MITHFNNNWFYRAFSSPYQCLTDLYSSIKRIAFSALSWNQLATPSRTPNIEDLQAGPISYIITNTLYRYHQKQKEEDHAANVIQKLYRKRFNTRTKAAITLQDRYRNNKRIKAAKKIQRNYSKKNYAAKVIQKAFTKHKAAQQFLKDTAAQLQALRDKHNLNQAYQTYKRKTKAATVIQKAFTKHKKDKAIIKMQKEFIRLITQKTNPSFSFTEDQKKFMEDFQNITSLSQDAKIGGNSPVYFHKPWKLLFKDAKEQNKLIARVNNNARFRLHFLSRPANEKYNHLIIPKTKPIDKTLLVEDYLPITASDKMRQIALYVENKEKFTPAIKELARLFCHAKVTDLVDQRWTRFLNIAIRRDNLPIFLQNDKGYIGLIDLEYFKMKPKKFCDLEQWQELVLFFPYHADEIVEEIQKYFPFVSKNWFTEEEKVGKFLIETKYTGHKKFLEEKGITLENYNQKPDISEEVKKELQDAVENVLKNLFTEKKEVFPNAKEKIHYYNNSKIEYLESFKKDFAKIHKKEDMKQLAQNLVDSLVDDFFLQTLRSLDKIEKPKDEIELLQMRQMITGNRTTQFFVETWTKHFEKSTHIRTVFCFCTDLCDLIFQTLEDKKIIHQYYRDKHQGTNNSTFLF